MHVVFREHHGLEETAAPRDLAHSPADCVVLSFSDSDLAAFAAGWRAAGHDLTVAVNLSVRHLTDLGLPRQVDDALRKHGLPASALVLEVTETLIMSDPVRATDVLHLLRELGVALAVDDFGTGYSSLAYLRRLDVHELKIDRSFVRHITADEGHATGRLERVRGGVATC